MSIVCFPAQLAIADPQLAESRDLNNPDAFYPHLFLWWPQNKPCNPGYRRDSNGLCREIWDAEEE